MRSTVNRSFDTKERGKPTAGATCTKCAGVCPYVISQVSQASTASIFHRTRPPESVTCSERTVSQRGNRFSFPEKQPRSRASTTRPARNHGIIINKPGRLIAIPPSFETARFQSADDRDERYARCQNHHYEPKESPFIRTNTRKRPKIKYSSARTRYGFDLNRLSRLMIATPRPAARGRFGRRSSPR
jgi:hypothetical protein